MPAPEQAVRQAHTISTITYGSGAQERYAPFCSCGEFEPRCAQTDESIDFPNPTAAWIVGDEHLRVMLAAA